MVNALLLIKIRYVGAFLCGMLVFMGCRGTSSLNQDPSRITFLKNMVEETHFEIKSTRAFPQMTQGFASIANAGLLIPGSTANSIDLIGNPNYVKILGDSVSVYLPYFGERQMGGGYSNNDVGIKYDGKPETYSASYDEKQNRYLIKMEFRQRTETFQCYITLFPSLRTDININSTHRFSIRYAGTVAPVDDE